MTIKQLEAELAKAKASGVEHAIRAAEAALREAKAKK